MISKLIYKEAYKQTAQEMGLSEVVVKAVYNAFWSFIRETMRSLPLKEGLTQEEFDKLKVNFNVPRLGKLFVTYKSIKEYNDGKGIKDKENQTDVHRDNHDLQ